MGYIDEKKGWEKPEKKGWEKKESKGWEKKEWKHEQPKWVSHSKEAGKLHESIHGNSIYDRNDEVTYDQDLAGYHSKMNTYTDGFNKKFANRYGGSDYGYGYGGYRENAYDPYNDYAVNVANHEFSLGSAKGVGNFDIYGGLDGGIGSGVFDF